MLYYLMALLLMVWAASLSFGMAAHFANLLLLGVAGLLLIELVQRSRQAA